LGGPEAGNYVEFGDASLQVAAMVGESVTQKMVCGVNANTLAREGVDRGSAAYLP
jgi:hypothetical protein